MIGVLHEMDNRILGVDSMPILILSYNTANQIIVTRTRYNFTTVCLLHGELQSLDYDSENRNYKAFMFSSDQVLM